ncbi:MAG: HD domain-containing phosphohydrolase, partial [Smithellaceae bacterium]|nr:HD domain-containing phosphohydrolase [Smithellaceae bacterium]
MEENKPSRSDLYPDNPQISKLLNDVVDSIIAFTEEQLYKIKKLSEIGLALSAEKALDYLLEKIIHEARSFTNADGGTLYILNEDESSLVFAIVQTESLNIRMGGKGSQITWTPVPLFNPDGSHNHANVSAYSALRREVVNISDVYHANNFNFEGTRKFDAQTGFHSKSMLVVPMEDHEGTVIGVLQLLNAREPGTGRVMDFSVDAQILTEALASQAAVAITNNRLISGLENLLESFVKTIATAIDEKSPYTGGHVRRVAELSLNLAQAVNNSSDGPYKDVFFSSEELKELRMAAWLHDMGKITTPEYVVDKATRLQTINDRIELVKARIEIKKRDIEISLLKQQLGGEGGGAPDTGHELRMGKLKDDLQFIIDVNLGKIKITAEDVGRLREISREEIFLNAEPIPLLTEDELYNLSIPSGTLNEKERDIIRNHAVVTGRMLSQLPFPKKLRNVSRYAASHHEMINGSGYPFGIGGAELGLQSRIIALADVLEALTARDRPYKPG